MLPTHFTVCQSLEVELNNSGIGKTTTTTHPHWVFPLICGFILLHVLCQSIKAPDTLVFIKNHSVIEKYQHDNAHTEVCKEISVTC